MPSAALSRPAPARLRRPKHLTPASALSGQLLLRNRQRTRPLDRALLKRIGRALLRDLCRLPAYALGVHLVGHREITHLNETFLHHAGPTDVIAFDHHTPGDPLSLHGEVFLCVDEAIRQARRFRTTWPDEIVRYLVHGVLHLLGHDDRTVPRRRRMKAAEDQYLRQLSRRFRFLSLALRHGHSAPSPRCHSLPCSMNARHRDETARSSKNPLVKRVPARRLL